jgi:hypothetical protein
LVEKNRCPGLMRALLGPIDETRNCAGMPYPQRWNLQFEMNKSRRRTGRCAESRQIN